MHLLGNLMKCGWAVDHFGGDKQSQDKPQTPFINAITLSHGVYYNTACHLINNMAGFELFYSHLIAKFTKHAHIIWKNLEGNHTLWLENYTVITCHGTNIQGN